jgi:RHS repeat-associated protein
MLTGLGIDEYFQWTDSSGSSDLLTDALGSTLELTDSTGTMQTTYSYDPFGATSINYFQSSNPFQFTGCENDWPNLYPELYFYRARYYNPMFQRFISQDPLDFVSGSTSQGPLASPDRAQAVGAFSGNVMGEGAEGATAPNDANLYAYVADSPTNYVDPYGLHGITYCWIRWLLEAWQCDRYLGPCKCNPGAYQNCTRRARQHYRQCITGIHVLPPLPPYGQGSCG